MHKLCTNVNNVRMFLCFFPRMLYVIQYSSLVKFCSTFSGAGVSIHMEALVSIFMLSSAPFKVGLLAFSKFYKSLCLSLVRDTGGKKRHTFVRSATGITRE